MAYNARTMVCLTTPELLNCHHDDDGNVALGHAWKSNVLHQFRFITLCGASHCLTVSWLYLRNACETMTTVGASRPSVIKCDGPCVWMQSPPSLLRRDVDLQDAVFVCGDHRDTATFDGAMLSGRRAVEALTAKPH